MNERSFLKIVVTPAHLKFEGQDPLADFIAAGRTGSSTPVEGVTDYEQPLGRLNRGMLNFAKRMVGSRPVNVGLSAATLAGAAAVFQGFHENNQDVAYADGLIAAEGVYAMVGPTLMGAEGRISPNRVVDYLNERVANGFKVESIFIYSGGVLYTYIPGAPEFVNNQPTSLNESNKVPSNEPIIFRVGMGEKPFVEGIDEASSAQMVDAYNTVYKEMGFPQLIVDSMVRKDAEIYAEFLYRHASRSNFDHRMDGKSSTQRAQELGYKGVVGEVITLDYKPVNMIDIVRRLVNHPGHREIILDITNVHIGVVCFQGFGERFGAPGRIVLICVGEFATPQ